MKWYIVLFDVSISHEKGFERYAGKVWANDAQHARDSVRAKYPSACITYVGPLGSIVQLGNRIVVNL